ncbi:MAG: alkaline phosphatase D family protein [Leeuwenhoekiella sp.]
MSFFKSLFQLLFSAILIAGCGSGCQSVANKSAQAKADDADFVIAFGSCNKPSLPNPFWKQMDALDPDVFIWGGDNVYADTGDMRVMKRYYDDQLAVEDYAAFAKNTPILGTWDDHDYGKNDAGVEWSKKDEAQQLLLDFLGEPKESPRRTQKGVYDAQVFETDGKTIKIILLDTRYFRSPLQESSKPGERYTANPDTNTTILGETQWNWLANELRESPADFTVIVSSIQFLSGEHGFEKWNNFPHEVAKMEKLILDSPSQNIIFLSGDRHISEFSRKEMDGLDYPLIDFTSSGLTHAYTSFDGEPNTFRVGEVITTESFGLLSFDLKSMEVTFEIRTKDGVAAALIQRYE